MQNDDWEQGFISPSFNSYSCDKLADVAAKVCREFNDLNLLDQSGEKESEGGDKNDKDNIYDNEFEFVSFQTSGEQVFFDDNQIGPVFPVFNRDLLFDKSQPDLLDHTTAARDSKVNDDDEDAALPSSSSSDVDELETVPPGTYCVWMPKSAGQEDRGKCKKSKSTGTSSSRRWSLRDLLRRSNSEGGKNSSFVFLTPLSSSSKKVEDQKNIDEREKVVPVKENKSTASGSSSGLGSSGPKRKAGKGPNAVSMAHEAFYVRNKTVAKDGYNKRRSYLPYRQDLVGFFASVNAMSRTFPAL